MLYIPNSQILKCRSDERLPRQPGLYYFGRFPCFTSRSPKEPKSRSDERLPRQPGSYYFRIFPCFTSQSPKETKSRSDVRLPRCFGPYRSMGFFQLSIGRNRQNSRMPRCRSTWHSSIMTHGAHLRPFDCVITLFLGDTCPFIFMTHRRYDVGSPRHFRRYSCSTFKIS
jgi:hypothetical protein